MRRIAGEKLDVDAVVVEVRDDGAGWHKSNELTIPAAMQLQFLPPYCPEINCAEHIWEELREKEFANACAESFWARLKVECLYRRKFATRAEARAAIFEYIATYYNRVRIHSSIGYQTPEAFERAYFESLEKAS